MIRTYRENSAISICLSFAFICHASNLAWGHFRDEFCYMVISSFMQLSLEVSKTTEYIHNAQVHDVDEPENILAHSFGGDFSIQGFGRGSKYTQQCSVIT